SATCAARPTVFQPGGDRSACRAGWGRGVNFAAAARQARLKGVAANVAADKNSMRGRGSATMNRHERRRAEAQQRAQELRSQKDAKPMKAATDKGFGEYRDFYRKAFCGASDRAIGEGFMRGERIAAAGAEHMVIYLHGESPSPPVEDDLWFSVAYGP